MARITEAQRMAIFGQPCAPALFETVVTPWGLPTRVHRLLVPRFKEGCRRAKEASRWEPRRIDSYACRNVRGGASYSLHSWCLAHDWFDRPFPQPVDVWGRANAPDRPFLDAFASVGFALGADFSTRPDYPHIEWADARPGPLPSQPQEDDNVALTEDEAKDLKAVKEYLAKEVAPELRTISELLRQLVGKS